MVINDYYGNLNIRSWTRNENSVLNRLNGKIKNRKLQIVQLSNSIEINFSLPFLNNLIFPVIFSR